LHCGRTLPEGLAALLLRLRGGPVFSCWIHGEDFTMQWSSSREMRLLTVMICRYAKRLFVNSRYTASLLGRAGVEPGRVHVIYPGVDTERFKPAADGSQLRRRLAPEGGPLLLSLGRLEPRKGFDLALRSVASLKPVYPTLKYVLAGDGPDRERLARLIGELGLGSTAVMVGKVGESELATYYGACDVFVHPNRIEGVDVEGFGIVFLEAAASGRPAIGGRSGGVPEAVLEGETGLLVGGADPDELTTALRSLLDSPEERLRLGERGRQRALESFTWEVAAKRLELALSNEGAVPERDPLRLGANATPGSGGPPHPR
jgi:phosphatidylinositol alpha-1,6-mannosyltransferase